MMLAVLSPLLQINAPLPDAVNVTLPPSQKDSGEEAVTTGAVGAGFTVTFVGADTAEVHDPLMVRRVMAALVFTEMLWLVSPLLHSQPLAAGPLRVTLFPSQKVVEPDAVITAAGGAGLSVTLTGKDAADVQVPLMS